MVYEVLRMLLIVVVTLICRLRHRLWRMRIEGVGLGGCSWLVCLYGFVSLSIAFDCFGHSCRCRVPVAPNRHRTAMMILDRADQVRHSDESSTISGKQEIYQPLAFVSAHAHGPAHIDTHKHHILPSLASACFSLGALPQ